MSDIALGMEVSINPQADSTRSMLVRGIVKEVLTSNQDHPHGVKVVLESGDIGRVKEVHTSVSPNVSSPDSHSINNLLAKGEDHFVELKTSAFWSKYLSPEKLEKTDSHEVKQHGRRASAFIIAKSIAGFSNADGGHLFIGIKENKQTDSLEFTGIKSEFSKLTDQSVDGYRRALIDDVIKPYLPSFFMHRINDHVRMDFPTVEGNMICYLEILKSKQEIFVTSKKDQFFVRIEASTREIQGAEIVQYCKSRF